MQGSTQDLDVEGKKEGKKKKKKKKKEKGEKEEEEKTKNPVREKEEGKNGMKIQEKKKKKKREFARLVSCVVPRPQLSGIDCFQTMSLKGQCTRREARGKKNNGTKVFDEEAKFTTWGVLFRVQDRKSNVHF